MTKTSHLAVRTIASDTDPIMKRSTGVCPVGFQSLLRCFFNYTVGKNIYKQKNFKLYTENDGEQHRFLNWLLHVDMLKTATSIDERFL